MRALALVLALAPLPALSDPMVSCVMEELCVAGFPCEAERLDYKFAPDDAMASGRGTGMLFENTPDDGAPVSYRTTARGLVVIEAFEDDGSLTRLVLRGDGLGVLTLFNGQQKILIQAHGECSWL